MLKNCILSKKFFSETIFGGTVKMLQLHLYIWHVECKSYLIKDHTYPYLVMTSLIKDNKCLIATEASIVYNPDTTPSGGTWC